MHESGPTQPVESGARSDATTSEAIPKHTTPTWESELLLSGATVFGLLQFPSYLYALIDRLHHQLSAMWDDVLLLGSMFSLAIVYALIVTFLLHLASRAYWVALVGLRSVYPQGIRWERSRSGPVGRRVQQSLFGDMDELIERADNRSTLIFSTGIAIVFNSLVAVLVSAPALVLAAVLQFWVWPLSQPASWFMITMAVTLIPLALARVIDATVGDRLAPDGTFVKWLARMMRWATQFGPWHLAEPLVLFLTTNMRRKHGFVLFLILIYALFFTTSELEKLRRKGFDQFPSALLLQSVPTRQASDYYENAGAPSKVLPHIQSDMVVDPYLRLWVPLDPHRSQALVRACSTRVKTAMRFHADAANTCLGDVFAPTLDGRRLTGLTWHLYRDPSLEIDGLRAYVPIQSLASGEHELQLAAPALDDADPDDKSESWSIPFWR